MANKTDGPLTPEGYRALAGRLTLSDQLAKLVRQEADRAAFEAVGVHDGRSFDHRPRTWGEQFVAAEQIRSWSGGATTPVIVRAADLPDPADPIVSTDLPGVPNLATPVVVPPVPPLLEAVRHETVSPGPLSYLVTTGGTAGLVDEGAEKPDAGITLDAPTVRLNLYAWSATFSRQVIEDLGRLRAVIDGLLRAGVTRAVSNGVATAIAAASIPDAGTLAQALAAVSDNGYAPTTVLLNPGDVATDPTPLLSLLELWEARLIASPAIPTGTAIVGDFLSGVTVFERGEVAILLTDSHDENFTSNKVVVLAEARALPAITNVDAIAKATIGS